MNCRDYREIILTTRAADRPESVSHRLADHELGCPACAEYRREAEHMERLLRAMPAHTASAGFTRSVMAKVAEQARPAHGSWFERVFGLLRPPAPLMTAQQLVATAALVLMLASAGMLLTHHRGPGDVSQPATITMASGPSGAVIEVDKEFVNEMVIRHQGAAAMQPLADGDGMRLVSY